MTENIEYHSPDMNIGREEGSFHSVELDIDGEVVGEARLEYRSRPIPYYLLYELEVDEAYRGQGYSSKIMDKVEEFLTSKGKTGVVADGIDIFSPASGDTTSMYERRGWELIPGEISAYTFNFPKDADPAVLKGYFRRYKN